MDVGLILNVLRLRRRLRAREQWARSRLAAFQADALRALRKHAYKRSRFYARFHRGLEDRPLDELPVLSKSELMSSFDELVTDPHVRLAEVVLHLELLRGDELFLGRYRISRTSGNTGHSGIFLADSSE